MTENQIHLMCEVRGNLWREFVKNYQIVMLQDDEALSQYIADWQKRFVAVGQ